MFESCLGMAAKLCKRLGSLFTVDRNIAGRRARAGPLERKVCAANTPLAAATSLAICFDRGLGLGPGHTVAAGGLEAQ